ncbi:carbon-nitrogen hydrolase family protein [Variovorax sp. J22G73]|uniref:carbon-nitrogen hydrolase family protein n=1 Tax=unclassified Variovorax TaxID=663243 RepID=UPI000D5F939E|nr:MULTISPECIES: carbon-nitrogen hydrolase family protein [unclassified Variovorax]MDM0003374.1 carbon-nitrogen hydrolase family protein [Variovorax sp. J22R203]MDM0096960.1 carbon-nitrogen hydrolase family protein [Variovorax sp. J22G73]
MPTTVHPKLRVAAVQAAPVFLDLDGTIDKTIDLMAQAAAQGVQLIAFPETWVPGYPWWIWLDSPAWGMQFVQRYHDNSLVIGSPEFDRLKAAARKHRIWLSFGYSEKAAGSLYIAQALIDDQGNTVQTRRKLKPTHVERTVFGEGDGADLHVVPTPIGNIGSLCCWEHLQPLSKYAMYAQNEQIHCGAWPSFSLYRGAAYALGHEVNNAASQVYAVEGGCFVIAPCATVSKAMSELMCTDAGKQQMLGTGGGYARIYAPDGSPLGTPLADDAEGLVVADIDLGMISLAKAAADPSGHYARPDVTQLLLNKTRREPVVVQLTPEPEASVPQPEPKASVPQAEAESASVAA